MVHDTIKIFLLKFSSDEINLFKDNFKNSDFQPDCNSFSSPAQILKKNDLDTCDLLIVNCNRYSNTIEKLPGNLEDLINKYPTILINERYDEGLFNWAIKNGILDIFSDLHDKKIYFHIFGILKNKKRKFEIENYIKQIKKEKKQTELSNKKKSKFLAQLSHEVRTPMTTIIGMTDLMFDTDITSEQKRYLDICKESAEDLLSYMKDIVDYTRIESGKIQMENSCFDLLLLIERIVSSFSLKVNRKNLDLLYQIDSRVPCYIIGDAKKLRQILVNILHNSIKFTEEGEIFLNVTIEDGQADECNKLKAKKKNLVLQFSISDTGIGMQEDKLDKIFDSFTRLHNKDNDLCKGTGLGLAITKELILLMKGKIWVESRVGSGSVFYFTIPFEIPEKDNYDEVFSEAYNDITRQILVVDNNRNNAQIIRALLKKVNINSDLVFSGDEAIHYLEKNSGTSDALDLILVNHSLQDMDGCSLIKEIRSKKGFEDSNIFIMLPSDKKVNQEEFELLKIDDFIEKPIRHLDLLDKMCVFLDKRKIIKTTESSGFKDVNINKKLNILLAEDDEINREVIAKLLRRVGHDVTNVENGNEVLKVLEIKDIDIILMDIKMPEVDGLQATRKIRNSNTAYRSIPIIAMTACVLPGDKQKCIEVGMDGYISKPIKGKILIKEVERIFNEKNNSN